MTGELCHRCSIVSESPPMRHSWGTAGRGVNSRSCPRDPTVVQKLCGLPEWSRERDKNPLHRITACWRTLSIGHRKIQDDQNTHSGTRMPPSSALIDLDFEPRAGKKFVAPPPPPPVFATFF